MQNQKLSKATNKFGITSYKNEKGQWHREDGPAVEWPDGDVWYYLNGVAYSKKDWEEEVIKIRLERLKGL